MVQILLFFQVCVVRWDVMSFNRTFPLKGFSYLFLEIRHFSRILFFEIHCMILYPPPTYTHKPVIKLLFCEDMGCSPENLPEAMNDREEWRERVRDIHAGGTTWWFFLNLFFFSFFLSPYCQILFHSEICTSFLSSLHLFFIFTIKPLFISLKHYNFYFLFSSVLKRRDEGK